MKKICIIATVPYALDVFMKPHIAMLSKYYDVVLITNGLEQGVTSMLGKHVRSINVNFSRKVSLWQDVMTLFQLYQIFREERFDLVHSLMPKTGLLAMVSALAAGVPVRIHTFTGQVWANKKGFSRWALKNLDRLIATCASGLLADSFSQRQYLIDHHVANKNKITVLGNGSICGVDLKRFKADEGMRTQIRTTLGILNDDVVYLYLGRLNADKGILDLALAFASLTERLDNIHLVVVGPDESNVSLRLEQVLKTCQPQFHRVDFTDTPERYMACADVFCLPSYREGFGSVIIEAAAAGVPAIASNIYGLADAVENGVTGILHQPKNIGEIKSAMLEMYSQDVRVKFSKQAFERTKSLFSSEIVVLAMRNYYQSVLH